MATPVESKIVIASSLSRPGFLPNNTAPISPWMSSLAMMFFVQRVPGFALFCALRDRVDDDFGVPEELRIQLLFAALICADCNDVCSALHQIRFHKLPFSPGRNQDIGLLNRFLLGTCDDDGNAEFALDVRLVSGKAFRGAASGVDLFDLHSLVDRTDLHSRLITCADRCDRPGVLSRQCFDGDGSRRPRSEASDQASIHDANQRTAPGIKQENGAYAIGHAMFCRVVGEPSRVRFHGDDFIAL